MHRSWGTPNRGLKPTRQGQRSLQQRAPKRIISLARRRSSATPTLPERNAWILVDAPRDAGLIDQPDVLMTERRFSDEEVAQIFERATSRHALQATRAAEGMTLAELQSIGAEVGIPAEQITRAALSLSPSTAKPTERFLGMTTGVGHTVHLARKLTDEEWERFIVQVRETFNARGTMTSQGSLKQWSNGNLQVMLEPTEAGHRVRFKTVKGSAPGIFGVGLLMSAASLIGETTAVLTGVAHDVGLVVSLGVLGAIGLGAMATTALRLPRWASERKAQMEELGARASAMALNPPPASD